MSLVKFSEVLSRLGCAVEIKDSVLLIDIEEYKLSLIFDEAWLKSIDHFNEEKQYNFDPNVRALTSNSSVEFQIINLKPNHHSEPNFILKDDNGSSLIISQATNEYKLGHFYSAAYDIDFPLIKDRLKRVYKLKKISSRRINIIVESLLIPIPPYTAKYTPKPKLARDELISVGKEKIKASLFNLAFTQDQCLELRVDFNRNFYTPLKQAPYETDLTIPNIKYDEDLVSYYKVAKSSLFPEQRYLSFYHILEYNFLKVADELVFNSVKSHLNVPNYKATYSNVNKLLSVIKKHDKRQDETEMLKEVLRKYVLEDDLIEFIKELEKSLNDNPFSNKKTIIFGKQMSIKLEAQHALSNTATVIKFIRNSLVHSSDRYSREDCFIPFSESEPAVSKYIPIIQFLAEKVIFSTAS